MSKHRHGKTKVGQQHQAFSGQEKISSLQQMTGEDMTPGRAPAEGGDVSSPTHERWAQCTPDRDPAEGPDIP